MKILIDTDEQSLTVSETEIERKLPLYSKESFEIISKQWVNVGWDQRYSYTFSWMGRPIIQLPEDMIRTQEIIYSLRPDLIIETGIAHGGSLIYYASIFEALGHGRVIGVDIEVRDHNLKAIQEHQFFDRIDLVVGNSVEPKTISKVKNLVGDTQKILVILDSDHSYKHVMAELEAYKCFVSPGSFIVATDGIMKDLSQAPRGSKNWDSDNPYNAAKDFCHKYDNFEVIQPAWPFNESDLSNNITHWPGAWIKCKSK